MTAQQAATALAAPVDTAASAPGARSGGRGCGTRASYAKGCRCHPCRDASAKYARDKYRAIAYGTWRGKQSPERYQQMIQAWRDQGITVRAISQASGLAEKVLDDLTNGRRKMISAATAQALENARPVAPGTGHLDATGTRRRLQALMAVGWPQAPVADLAGVAPSVLSRVVTGHVDRISVSTATLIAAAYDQLWDRTPPAGQGSTIARRRAAAAHWPRPMAWDDETIDDPRAKPAGIVKPVRRENPFRPLDDLVVAEITELHRLGHSDSAIARRLGKSASAIQKVRNRYDIRRAS